MTMMPFCPDLHTHSTSSDGVLSPELLVHEAARLGINIIALTDHDTFEGSDLLRQTEQPIRVLPGVELSMRDMHGLHLLGYGYTEAKELREVVQTLAEKRVDRARMILERLKEQGMPLDWQTLQRKCQGTVGRPHIARAMVHAGYVASMQEAFERYLAHGKPAYVPSERMSMSEALPLMRRNGFVPVLAHPCELNQSNEALITLLEHWKEQGLMGVEVYHPSARNHGMEQLDRMSRRMGLLVTGGSDFHQENDRHGRIGCMNRDWLRANDDIEALLDALENTNRKND